MEKCIHHNDCFTCPFPDCIKSKKSLNKHQANEIPKPKDWKDKADLREYKKLLMRKYRADALKLEFPHINFEIKGDENAK